MASPSPLCLCYCGSGGAGADPSSPHRGPICQPCATHRLAAQISRFRSEAEKRDRKREEYRRRLLETRLPASDNSEGAGAGSDPSRRPLPDPTQINSRASRLRKRLDALRSRSNDLAVRATAKAAENDAREERLRACSDRGPIGEGAAGSDDAVSIDAVRVELSLRIR